MTDDFADIRARLDAATPGPWCASVGDVLAEQQWYDVDSVGRERRYVAEVVHEGNADLIAHAPADLRRLLDEVVRLRALLGTT